ncbi:MAG: ParB/RepB/Spo0J family partition protein [Myxococcaceae bacterium]
MADSVRLVDPKDLHKNKDNPRLIFRQEDLDALEKSIADQGILVPLTVFQEGDIYRLLDGERRWRCAIKLGLPRVPVIVQPKPNKLQNLMMMFAIHHARKDWDPLPTALKLQDLETEFQKKHDRSPSEAELAGLASMSRGEVRRLRTLLSLPENYRQELLDELEKPRNEQVLTVDHVLEVTKAATALEKRAVVDERGAEHLRRALIHKVRTGVSQSTLEPRKLARLARAVDREEVEMKTAVSVVRRLINDADFTIEMAFHETVEQIDFQHGLEQLTTRVSGWLEEHAKRKYRFSPKLRKTLEELQRQLHRALS